jgi:hypothetical protein
MDRFRTVLLDFSESTPYNNKVNKFKQMSLTDKFKKDIQTLKSAANGDSYLDVKNPKLFKKVRKFYESNGVIFSGDPLDDYEMLIDYIYADLEAEGVLVS